MTRLGHGGLTLNRDWIGVDELIGSAVARLQRYAARRTLRDRRCEPTTWRRSGCTRRWWSRRLFNVLENAAKFSPPGAAGRGRCARRSTAQLRIDVRDRGPGIPEDERKRIFDMFYSVERGDRGRQGTGLGLAICQGMIGAHGGSVEALPGRDGAAPRSALRLPRIEPLAAAER